MRMLTAPACKRCPWARAYTKGLCIECYQQISHRERYHRLQREAKKAAREAGQVPRKCCKHCQDAVVTRPRGLCWVCWHDLAIRALYPAKVRHDRGNPPRMMPAPTSAFPGTPAKVEVLAERCRFDQELWHPDDA